MKLKILYSTLIGTWVGSAWGVTPSEIHKFHILGKVKYRCYAGYDGKKIVDEVTKQPCDNKNYQSVLVDKIVSVNIVDEADPEGSKALAGSWGEEFDFKGRKFVIAMTLFKEPSQSPYRVRLVAKDSEIVSRNSAVFTEMKNLSEMNTLSVDYSSAGKKEEVSFWVEVKASFQK